MPEWIEVAFRSILFLLLLFVMAKLLGKKQLSQLSFFEYVTGITVGSIGAEMITGLDRNIVHGIGAIIIFTLIPIGVGLLSMKSKRFRQLVEGKGVVFIKDGKIMENNLKKERYTTDELLELLRQKDVFKAADVEFAVLEASGDLSVLLKEEHKPVTPHMLGIGVPVQKEPQTVIMDGVIMDEPLATIGLNRGWLNGELDRMGLQAENVFLGQVDGAGVLTVDLFDDSLQVPVPAERPLLLALMKKTQADLAAFSLATDVPEAKDMYNRHAEALETAIDQAAPFLK